MNDLTLVPKQNISIFAQEVDNEVLILDRKGNKIHQLNTTASFIWQKCDGHNSIYNIVNTMIENFNISSKEAEKDVLDTISLLQKNNLLE
jgi:methyltransferase-like protein